MTAALRLNGPAVYAPNRPGKKVRLLPVPDVRQAWVYSCGAAALQAVLAYYGKGDPGESYLVKQLRTTPSWGTEPIDIQRVARSYGLSASLQERMTIEQLEQYANKGVAVIVAYQAWRDRAARPWSKEWNDGHYSVVVGVDKDNVYFEDPSLIGEIGYIPKKEFMDRWRDVGKNNKRFYQLGIVIESKTQPLPGARISRIP